MRYWTLLALLATSLAAAPAAVAAPVPTATPAAVQIPTGASPKSVTISDDGKLAYVMNLEACTISVFDTGTHKLVRTISFPQTPARGWDYEKGYEIPSVAEKPVQAAFTHGGKYMWVSLHNAQAVVVFAVDGKGFDPKSHKNTMLATVHEADGKTWWRNMLRIPTGKTPKVLAVSPDGKYVAVSNWHGDSVTVINARTFKPVKTLPVESIPRGMVFSRDGRRLYVGIMGGTQIDVFNTTSWKKSSIISNVGVAPRELILDRAGRFLYSSCNSSCTITKIDATKGKTLASISVGSEPRTIAFSPDERRIYAVCYGSHKLYVVDTEKFKVVDTLSTGENPVGIAVAPSGDIWVTNQSGDSVTLYPASRPPAASAKPKASAH